MNTFVYTICVPALRNPKAATLKLAVTTIMLPTAARYEPSKRPDPELWKKTRTGAFFPCDKTENLYYQLPIFTFTVSRFSGL